MKWKRSTFACRWVTRNSQLAPGREIEFPSGLAARYLRLIRRVAVRITHLDPYTGGVKYGFEGQGYTDGVRDQVALLCTDFLGELEEVQWLSIWLDDRRRQPAISQQILIPFLDLRNTRTIDIGGGISAEMKETLKARLSGAKGGSSSRIDPFEHGSHI